MTEDTALGNFPINPPSMPELFSVDDDEAIVLMVVYVFQDLLMIVLNVVHVK